MDAGLLVAREGELEAIRALLRGDGAHARALVLGFLLKQPEVERVTYLHLEFVGPSRYYLVAAVDIVGEDRETTVAHRLREVERELEVEDVIEEAVITLSTPEDESITA